jgi:hypothetical protein
MVPAQMRAFIAAQFCVTKLINPSEERRDFTTEKKNEKALPTFTLVYSLYFFFLPKIDRPYQRPIASP